MLSDAGSTPAASTIFCEIESGILGTPGLQLSQVVVARVEAFLRAVEAILALIQVILLKTSHLQEMVEQTLFEWLVAVDRHREANDASFLSVNVMTSLSS